jgi:hypothetical protein
LNEFRDALRGALPKDVAAELKRLDGQFRKYATLRKAAGYKAAAEQGGIFTPSQLMSAVTAGKGVSKSAVAQGKGVYQQETLDALDVLGDVRMKPGFAEKVTAPLVAGGALLNLPATLGGYAGVRAAFSEPARRAALGQTATQEAALRLAVELRRYGIGSAQVAAALEE